MFALFNTLLAQSTGRITIPQAPGVLSPGSSPEGAVTFGKILRSGISLLFITGVLIFILFFIIGALKWILSSGDKQALQNAREAVLHAVIGLLVMFALYVILRIIEIFLGVCLIQLGVPGIDSTGITSQYCGAWSDTPGPGPNNIINKQTNF